MQRLRMSFTTGGKKTQLSTSKREKILFPLQYFFFTEYYVRLASYYYYSFYFYFIVLFRTRARNMLLYGYLGGREFFTNTQRYLERKLTLEVHNNALEDLQNNKAQYYMKIFFFAIITSV